MRVETEIIVCGRLVESSLKGSDKLPERCMTKGENPKELKREKRRKELDFSSSLRLLYFS